MKADSFPRFQRSYNSAGFTLIELLVVIAIIAILAVVVILTLNPAQLLEQSRDANRLSDMATLASALNLYTTDQAAASTFSLGNASDTYPSTYDPQATTTAGDACQGLGMPSLNTSAGQSWQCSASSTSRNVNGTGWIPVNFTQISAGSPIGSLPVDPTNQTSTGLFYAYNTNGTQFEVTADLESQKYKTQYGNSPQTSDFPENISGGTPTVSSLFNPSGLVGYWPMDEGVGSSTIDRSGNGDAGTWAGAASGTNGTYYSGGKIGAYAGYFNGATDYVSLGNPSSIQATNAISVSAWVNPTTLSSYQRIVANYNGGSVNNGPFALSQWAGSSIICLLGNPSYFAQATTPTSSFTATGAWYHVACTYNGSSMALYINGALQGTSSATGLLSYSLGYPWTIGAAGSSTATTQNVFNGSIDDVRIYNRALSAAEVMALYDSEK